MEPKTGKRIVSRQEYVKAQGKRFSLGLSAALLLLATGLLILIALITVLAGIVTAQIIGIMFAPIFAGSAYILGKHSRKVLEIACNVDPGVPLTRANTADLPAPDSLVRASDEPMQAQKAVLLRAAAEGQETPPEELVRAVNGQE